METPCPASKPIIDRGFKVQPPACLFDATPISVKCTPDPSRAGYCLENFGALGVSLVETIGAKALCEQRMREWVQIEKEARAADGQS